MAVTSIFPVPKLPLTTWAKIIGFHPLHFEQVRLDEINPHCSEILFTHPWQTADAVSREEIAQAIAEAEAQIENALGYHLAPTWDVDEWHPTARPYRAELVNYNGNDIRGFRQTVQAKFGYVIAGGIEAKSLIEADAPIVYTDVDSDGYDETATVIVSTSVTEPSEVAIYYPGKSGADIWEIRPTQVSISGGNATIVFRREQVVVPEKLDVLDIEGAEAIGTEDEDFLEEVDVYRHYNDPQTQASFLWEPLGMGCGSCNGGGCPSCAFSAQTGCLLIRGDPRLAILGYTPAEWDSGSSSFSPRSWLLSRNPDIVRLYYYSGWRNKRLPYTNRMDPEWERVVAYMAAAKLDRPPCSCAKGRWEYWRQDLLLSSGDQDGNPIYKTPDGVLNNPFGTRRGEVYAWQRARREIIGNSVLV